MQTKRATAAALFVVIAGAISGVAAQESPQQNAEREAVERQKQAQIEAVEREVEAASEREGMERELAKAQREIEEAAREIARLSAQVAGPVVVDLNRRFRYAGQRALLGINIEDTERGVRVAGVSPNGPAARAGLQMGDTIVAIEGAQLADPRVTGVGTQSPSELLLAQMTNVDPGESVELRVLAESGAERDVTVEAREIGSQVFMYGLDSLPKLAELQKGFTFRTEGPGSAWTGFFGGNPWGEMQLVTLTPELGAYFGSTKGLLVVRGPESDALQLQDGDVILDIGGREPTTPEHALRILSSFQEGETLKIAIMRKQRREALEFQMPDDSAE